VGIKDQNEFKDAAAKAKSTIIKDWGPAVDALSRLAMFDMLPALAAINESDRGILKQLYLPRRKGGFTHNY
jgi:hypothetical protein